MALKRDFYEVLGVPRDADAAAIKAAYRALARQHHPDVSKAADAAAKFAEIQEAYDTLSDPAKRTAYDRHGHAGSAAGGSRWADAAGGSFDFDSDDLGSMFEAFFGGRGPGRGGASAPNGRAKAARRAEPHTEQILVSFMTAARGGTESLKLTINGRARTIEVAVPAGTQDGATIRVRPGGADPGVSELLLNVRVGSHPLFRRGEGAETGKGLDLFLDLPLSIAEAMLGASVSVPTLDGYVELTIPPGTSSGKRLRLRGRGITDARGRQGDLYAVVQVLVPPPAAVTEESRALLRDLSERSPPPRSGPEWTVRSAG